MVSKLWNERENLAHLKDLNTHTRLPEGWLEFGDEEFAIVVQNVAIVPNDLTLEEYHEMFGN